jgi:hypothetical protein
MSTTNTRSTVNIQYSIVSSGEDSFVTAFVPGEPAPLVAAKSGHPNFDAIIGALVSGDYDSSDEIVDLFDVSRAVAAHFENLSDRVQVGNGRVLFDGAEVDNSLTKQIVRFLDEDVEDWQPLVNFMENVMDNPQPHSQAQLFTWLDARDFTITDEGYIVAYKGVESDGNGGYRSISSGQETVYVDGAPHTGKIPNPVGAVINMNRGLVQHDPAVGCHVGLHVGTYEYAKSFSRGGVLEVHVNPRDVVSVPTEVTSFDPTVSAKMRTCRYEVVDVIDAPYTSAFLDPDGDDLDEQSWDFDSEDIGDESDTW